MKADDGARVGTRGKPWVAFGSNSRFANCRQEYLGSTGAQQIFLFSGCTKHNREKTQNLRNHQIPRPQPLVQARKANIIAK